MFMYLNFASFLRGIDIKAYLHIYISFSFFLVDFLIKNFNEKKPKIYLKKVYINLHIINISYASF